MSDTPIQVVGLREIAKSFGATQALRSCSLELRAGEIHALLGENGSGKTTLVKILAGVHRPDGGELVIAGQPMRRLRSPREALTLGIATVFQEVLVAGSRSLWENVWLGSDGLVRTARPRGEKRRLAAETLRSLLGETPALDTPLEELPLAVRQACVIARALVREPRVLVLDEATSSLDVFVRDRLLGLIRDAAGRGTATLFISHRMDEIEEIADRITVLRAGEAVATRGRGEASADELVQLMTGAQALVEAAAGKPRVAAAQRELVLGARGIVLRPGSSAIDLQVRAGELLGLAGLDGHGQDAMLRALAGSPPPEGTIVCDGAAIATPHQAAARGIVMVSRDRRSEGLFESKSILENFALPTLAADTSAGLLRASRTRARFARYVEALNIRLGDPRDPVTSLSGGNQQKVIMARWLAANPRILLLNDPTRGVDLGAKRDLYRLLRELAEQGVSIVMLSSELDEHVELMDRVLVFREYAIEREFSRGELTRNALVSAFFGQKAR